MRAVHFITLAALSLLSACTTIARGSSDYLRIDSIPQGASVTTTIETYKSKQRSKIDIRNEKEFETCAPTPCLIEVGRRKRFVITIEHPGYEPAELAINGEVAVAYANIDMAVPAGSVIANVGGGAGAAALTGYILIPFTELVRTGFVQILGPAAASSVPSVTSSLMPITAGIGVAMVGVDALSGSYANIYPNPVIIKLAPSGTPSLTDPNGLMFKLRQAKKSLASEYCEPTKNISNRQRKRNCEIAKEMDKKRNLENAHLLDNEDEIKAMIARLKIEVREQEKAARKNKPDETEN